MVTIFLSFRNMQVGHRGWMDMLNKEGVRYIWKIALYLK